MIKTELLMLKNFIISIGSYFKFNKKPNQNQGEENILIRPKRTIEYSNIIRRALLLLLFGQWMWLMGVSEQMYVRNGDLGDNWTKLMIAIIGLLSIVFGFYFSGNYSDRSTEEFKKIKQYDNDRLDEYHEEVKEQEAEVTPKATLEEDDDLDD